MRDLLIQPPMHQQKLISQKCDLNGVFMSVSRVKQRRWQLTGLAMALVGELANGMQISAAYGASYRQDFLI